MSGWLHTYLCREEVNDLLRDSKDGTFLVRDGQDKISYTLTVRCSINVFISLTKRSIRHGPRF